MDVFVFPSLWEGVPVSVVEAQAAGLKCYVSDTITEDVQLTELVQTIALHKAALSFDSAREGITFGLYARICITRRLTDTLEKLARQSSMTCDGFDVELFSDGKSIESGIVTRERMEEYCRIAKSILSDLEYQVFLLYVAGDTTAKIAEKLNKTPKSVDNAKARMFKSLRRYSDKFSDI